MEKKQPIKSRPVLIIQASAELVKLRDKTSMVLGRPIVRRFEYFTGKEIEMLHNHAIEAHNAIYDKQFYNDSERQLHGRLMKELLDEKSRRD